MGAAAGGRLTETGLSVGTPHYMSPEQATGDLSVGAATDVYALACVLYEMLVGEPPYTGSTAQAILGKIIQVEPVSAAAARRSVPANVDAAIRKALEKLSADRFTSAYDFSSALADAGFRHGEYALTPAGRRRSAWQAAALVGAGAFLGLSAVAVWTGARPEPTPAGVMRFAITPPQSTPLNLGGTHHDLAISRDGSFVVYQSGTLPADYQLNLRPLDQLESAPLRGTARAVAPFFSPDGEWVGFVEANTNTLLKVSVFGGPPVTLTETPTPMLGWSWGADDRIIFGSRGAGLFRVAGGGGEPEALTTLDPDRDEAGHLWPHVMEGRDLVVFVIADSGGLPLTSGQLAVLDLDTGEVTRLGIAGVSPRYVSTGHLVYAAADGSVRAVPFDAHAVEVTGSPVPLVEGVGVKASGAANFDVSDDGRLVYALGGGAGAIAIPTNLVLVARGGTRSLLAELESIGWYPRFSPDGSRVAYAVSADATAGSEADLWVLDVSRGARTRATFGGNNRFYPVWAPGGSRLTHADAAGNQNRLVSTPADGSGGAEALLELGDRRFPTSWSPDGRTLLYYVGPAGTPTNTRDLWMLTVDGGTPSPAPFVETPFMERGAVFSTDGKWVAYVSDKSGQNDVYARPFPGPGAEITVSVGGGQEPVWGPSGSELYYRQEGELLLVPVELASPSLSVGTPRTVFDDPFRRDTGGASGGMANYDIAPNGEAFVMVEDASSAGGSALTPQLYLVTNWFEELRQRMGN